jgi:phosphoribosylformimino-5-aminoimidazole carboxamide ribotide isomerase
LNAAVAHGSNEQIIDEVLRATAPLDVQVSGGVATSDRIEQLVRAGATSVVLGARALEDPDWLSAQASLYPRVLIVATDVRTQRVAIAGWVRTLKIDILDVVAELSTLALAGVLVSGLRLAGEMRGPDLALLEDVAAAAKVPVLAAGGIATMADLRALENRGIAGAVVGAALYTGVLDARMVAQEFGE